MSDLQQLTIFDIIDSRASVAERWPQLYNPADLVRVGVSFIAGKVVAEVETEDPLAHCMDNEEVRRAMQWQEDNIALLYSRIPQDMVQRICERELGKAGYRRMMQQVSQQMEARS